MKKNDAYRTLVDGSVLTVVVTEGQYFAKLSTDTTGQGFDEDQGPVEDNETAEDIAAWLEDILNDNYLSYLSLLEERDGVKVSADTEYWYVDFGFGMGAGAYLKSDWTLNEAIEDQRNFKME